MSIEQARLFIEHHHAQQRIHDELEQARQRQLAAEHAKHIESFRGDWFRMIAAVRQQGGAA